jgi:probable HAF family extracellular repeat protein
MNGRPHRCGMASVLVIAGACVVSSAYAQAAAGDAVLAADGAEDSIAADRLFADVSGVEIIDLGVLDGDANSVGLAINRSGWVVGESNSASEVHTFLWRPGIGLTRIEPPTASRNTTVAGINDLGVVLASAPLEPFLWRRGRTLPLKGQLDFGAALNNKNDVAGNLQGLAAIWLHGRLVMIGRLGGGFAVAQGINDDGVVAGVTETPTVGELHPFLWQNGTMRDLGALPGMPMCQVTGLSNTNIVVGYCYTSQTTQGFRYRNEVLAPLAQNPSSRGNIAFGVNNQGFVVGTDSSAGRAVGWTPKGTLVDLNELLPAGSGWTLYQAYAITDRFEIVGRGQTPSGRTHGFLLRPR